MVTGFSQYHQIEKGTKKVLLFVQISYLPSFKLLVQCSLFNILLVTMGPKMNFQHLDILASRSNTTGTFVLTGLMLGVFDLFEMKPVASLHCNIYGEMNASNLKLLGISTTKRPRPTDVANNDDTDLETLHHAVLDYHPNENTSYFFTFITSGDQLSMHHTDPVYINTHSPDCTKGKFRISISVTSQKLTGHSYAHSRINMHLIKFVSVERRCGCKWDIGWNYSIVDCRRTRYRRISVGPIHEKETTEGRFTAWGGSYSKGLFHNV